MLMISSGKRNCLHTQKRKPQVLLPTPSSSGLLALQGTSHKSSQPRALQLQPYTALLKQQHPDTPLQQTHFYILNLYTTSHRKDNSTQLRAWPLFTAGLHPAAVKADFILTLPF